MGIPRRPAEDPRNHVLEAAECRPLVPARTLQTKPILGVHVAATPGAAIRSRVCHVSDLRITVLEGDETGRELLAESLRLLDSAVCGLDVSSSNSTRPWTTAAQPTTR